MFSSGLDGRTQVLDLSNNTASEYLYQNLSLNISCQVQPPGHSPGKRGVSTSRWSLFLYFFAVQKTCALFFVFVLKGMKCLLQGFGIFNAFFFRTGKASLIQRAISTRIETQEEKHTMKLGQLKINCLPLLWDHIGPPWRPGQPHQPRWAGPFRQQTYPGRI